MDSSASLLWIRAPEKLGRRTGEVQPAAHVKIQTSPFFPDVRKAPNACATSCGIVNMEQPSIVRRAQAALAIGPCKLSCANAARRSNGVGTFAAMIQGDDPHNTLAYLDLSQAVGRRCCLRHRAGSRPGLGRPRREGREASRLITAASHCYQRTVLAHHGSGLGHSSLPKWSFSAFAWFSGVGRVDLHRRTRRIGSDHAKSSRADIVPQVPGGQDRDVASPKSEAPYPGRRRTARARCR